MEQTVEVFESDELRICCDGGEGVLGHPRVYLNLEKDGHVDCPYCGRRYVLRTSGRGG